MEERLIQITLELWQSIAIAVAILSFGILLGKTFFYKHIYQIGLKDGYAARDFETEKGVKNLTLTGGRITQEDIWRFVNRDK